MTRRPAPPVTSGIATAAAEKPPSTNAPSAPITVRPIRAGMAKASPVRISGAARSSVFWMEKADPKPPVQIRPKKAAGDLPKASRNTEKISADATSAPTRDHQRLDPAQGGGRQPDGGARGG